MKIWIIPIFLALLFSVGYAQTPWFDTSYQNRINVNLSVFQTNSTVDLNLTSLGVVCSNVNCTDVIVVDQNNNELLLANGRKAWQVPLDNVTSRNKPNNDFVVIAPQNNSLVYWIYYNNTGVNNTGGSLILWEDNFERYSVGQTPLKARKSNPARGDVCDVQGQKGAGCNLTGGDFVSWLVGNYTNVTVIWEVNSTQSADANSHLFTLFGNVTGAHYRMPQVNPANTWVGSRDGQPPNFASMVFFGDVNGGNVTSKRDGDVLTIGVRQNFSSGINTSYTSGNQVSYQPGAFPALFISLLQFTVYNQSVDFNETRPQTTSSAPESVPAQVATVLIQQPTGVSLVANVSINYSIQNPADRDRCQISIDNGANESLPNCANTTRLFANGNHSVKISVNNTDGVINISTALFGVDLDPPFVNIVAPNGNVEIAQAGDSTPLTFTITDGVIGVNLSSCVYVLNNASPVALPGCSSTTLTLAVGNYVINVSGLDNAGRQGSDVNTFTISISPAVTGVTGIVLRFIPLLFLIGVIIAGILSGMITLNNPQSLVAAFILILMGIITTVILTAAAA